MVSLKLDAKINACGVAPGFAKSTAFASTQCQATSPSIAIGPFFTTAGTVPRAAAKRMTGSSARAPPTSPDAKRTRFIEIGSVSTGVREISNMPDYSIAASEPGQYNFVTRLGIGSLAAGRTPIVRQNTV